MKSTFKKVKELIIRKHSFSIYRLWKFSFKFLILYFPTWLIFYIPFRLNLGSGHSFTAANWIVVSTSPLIIIIINYIRNILSNNSSERKVRQNKVVLTSINSIINLFSGYDFASAEHKKDYYEKVLIFIQRIMKDVLRQEGVEDGTICANLMEVDEVNSKLVIRYMGAPTDGHGKYNLCLDLNHENPAIGAPSVFFTKDMMYIDNTELEEYKTFLKKESTANVKSFISIPIFEDEDEEKIYAILNIDSDKVEQFVSIDFIKKILYPEIKVFTSLVKLGHDFFDD